MNTSRKYRQSAWNNYCEVAKTKHYGVPMFVEKKKYMKRMECNGEWQEVNMIKYWKYMRKVRAHTHTYSCIHIHTMECILMRECVWMYVYKYLLMPTASLRYQFRLLATDLSLMYTIIYVFACLLFFYLCATPT